MNRKMIALIVGNGKYQNGVTKLNNAANDASDMAAALDALGFTVIKHVDCKIEDLDRAISSFQDGLNSNDVGLFYFAGHGIQIDGENYITAIDSSFVDESSVRYTSYPLNRLIDAMDSCSNKTNLIILDACRDNPCERGWARSAKAIALAPMFAPKGTLIAYSTSPGETASDGVGENGAYTEALLKHINKPDMFKKPENLVKRISLHEKKVAWQLRRIYRTRNLIVHSGSSISYIETLIENAHDYLDQTMSSILDYTCGMLDASTLEQAFDMAKIDYEVYLKELKSSDKFSADNIWLGLS